MDVLWNSQKRWSTKIFRYFGAEVRVHFSLWVFFALILFSGMSGPIIPGTGQGVAGPVFALIAMLVVFTSILIHEMAHVMAAMSFHARTKGIMLFPMGGFSLIEPTSSPLQNMLISAVGPFTNLAVAATLYFLNVRGGILGLVFAVNLFLALFNLIPMFPLDGGRILLNFLSTKGAPQHSANKITLDVTRVMGIVLTALAILGGNFILLFLVIMIWVVAHVTLKHGLSWKDDIRESWRMTRKAGSRLWRLIRKAWSGVSY